MLTDRNEWFKFYGVTVPDRDPKTPLTPVAVITADILLDCYRRAEIERLDYLKEHLTKYPGQPSEFCNRWRRDNWAMFVRACFLIGHEPGQLEKVEQHPLFSA